MPGLQFKSSAPIAATFAAFPNGRAEVVTSTKSTIGRIDLPAWLAVVQGPRADHGNADLPAPPHRVLDLWLDAHRHGRWSCAGYPARFGVRDPPRARRMGGRRRAVGTVVWTSFGPTAWHPMGPRNGSWPRCCSPTSWIRRRSWNASVTPPGATCWPPTTSAARELNVFRGREVKTTGDGFLAVFDSPSRAVGVRAA